MIRLFIITVALIIATCILVLAQTFATLPFTYSEQERFNAMDYYNFGHNEIMSNEEIESQLLQLYDLDTRVKYIDFNKPNFHNCLNIANKVIGRAYSMFNVVYIDSNVNSLKLIILLSHELAHIKFGRKEYLANYNSITKLIESGNQTFKKAGCITAQNVLSSKHDRYNCSELLVKYANEHYYNYS